MNYEFYKVEKKSPIAWVFLDRPDKKNAMNPPAWTETIPIFDELDKDDDIRVIILTTRGNDFSAGIDLMGMMPTIPELMDQKQFGGIKRNLLPKIYDLQKSFTCIERCRKPVIAAVNGVCIGAGLDMITACDIRLCSQDATFCLKEAAVGFVADVGVLQRIPLIVGQGIARELAYTAKKIDSQRAKEILLVNEIYKDQKELHEQAEKMAIEIANNSPLAVQASKEVLNQAILNDIDNGLKYVASISANIIPSNDLMEAVSAFSEKRKPEFSGS